MTEGTVKFFHAEKQFGFINGDDGKSYYFHATQVEQGTRLTDGDKVTFTPVQGDRGPKAEKVKKLLKVEKAAEPAEEEAASEEPAEEEEEIEEDED